MMVPAMVAVIAFAVPAGKAWAQNVPAADALADRFAGADAAQVEAAAEAKAAAGSRAANAVKAAADAKAKAAAAAKARADAKLEQDEADMLARARAEAAAPRTEPAAAAAPSAGAGAEAEGRGDAIRRSAIDAEVERRLREAELQAELDALSAKIRRSKDLRDAATEPPPAASPATPVTAEPTPVDKAAEAKPVETKPAAPAASSAPAPSSERSAAVAAPENRLPDMRPADPAKPADNVAASAGAAPAPPAYPLRSSQQSAAPLSAAETRVTLLLVMEPGHAGIRRNNPSADPILCIREICYVSRGTEVDAIALPRQRAFGAANTLGARAGACSNQLGCVFRNVDLGGATAIVQPVDLRLIRHDRREVSEVRVDMGCAVRQSRLACTQTARGPDYRLWAVPESISANAGPAALMAALDSGLRTP